MKASEQQALIPQEATPDTSSTSSARRSRSPRPRPSCSRRAGASWTPTPRRSTWRSGGGIHAITEAVYDCADLAQRILDAGLAMENMCAKLATSRQMILIDDLRRSLDMDDGDVEATVDPDTGEIA